MYFFSIHGVPGPNNPDSVTVGGAFINCYINHATLDLAESIARKSIEEAGWQIVAIEESKIVNSSSFEEDSDGMKYYEQALVDKEVFAYFTYPGDGPENTP